MAEGTIRILNDVFWIPLSKQSQGRVLEDVTAHARGSWLRVVPDVLRGHIRHGIKGDSALVQECHCDFTIDRLGTRV
jgi:hypothetical protein